MSAIRSVPTKLIILSMVSRLFQEGFLIAVALVAALVVVAVIPGCVPQIAKVSVRKC